MKGYTQIIEVENYPLITVKEYFRPQIETWIGQVESYIDKLTGRNFIADTEFSTRKFEVIPPFTRDVWVNEFIEIDTLTVDDVVVSEDEYLVYPANTTPKNRIRLTDDYFYKDDQNIEISAKWGYSEEVPEDITLATTIMVVGIIGYAARRETSGGISSESIGPHNVSYDSPQGWADFEKAKEIIERYTLKLPI